MASIIRSAEVSPVRRQLIRRTATLPPASAAPVQAVAPLAVSAPVHDALTPAAAMVPAELLAQQALVEAESRQKLLDAALAKQRAEAEADIAAALADAERRGYLAGLEKGERASSELIHTQGDRLKSIIATLLQARVKVLGDAEDDLVELAFTAICRILGEQAVRREVIVLTLRESVAASRERDGLVIRIHPDDLELLRLGADGPEPPLGLRADAQVLLGGCIIDSNTGSLDARLETQIARLAAVLAATRAARRHEEEAV